MARPKKGVTVDNIFQIRQYFDRAIEDKRLWDEEPPQYFSVSNAIREFKLLFSKEMMEETGSIEEMQKVKDALQNWIDKYVPPKKWQRCLKTLRQRVARKRLRLHHLDVNQEVYACIKQLSKRFGLRISETIYKIAKAELERVHEKEEA